jgi:hypothetical protein
LFVLAPPQGRYLGAFAIIERGAPRLWLLIFAPALADLRSGLALLRV